MDGSIDDHKKGAQRERNPEENINEHGPDLGPTAGWEEVRDHLLQILEIQAGRSGLHSTIESNLSSRTKSEASMATSSAQNDGDTDIGRP